MKLINGGKIVDRRCITDNNHNLPISRKFLISCSKSSTSYCTGIWRLASRCWKAIRLIPANRLAWARVSFSLWKSMTAISCLISASVMLVALRISSEISILSTPSYWNNIITPFIQSWGGLFFYFRLLNNYYLVARISLARHFQRFYLGTRQSIDDHTKSRRAYLALLGIWL